MLHDQKISRALAGDVIQRADVRLVQDGDGLGLTLEALSAFRVGGQLSAGNTLIATVRSRRVSVTL